MELSKRALGTSKKTKKHTRMNKSDIAKVYGTSKKNMKKQKLQIGKHNKIKDVQEYSFPGFAIDFKDAKKGPIINSCINNQILNSKVEDSKKSPIQKKVAKNNKISHEIQFASKNPGQNSKIQNNSSFKHYTFRSNTNDEGRTPLERQYQKCIQKVFNILDIFNKGKISQANINKWLPEPALYFLGKIFQKIRNERLSLYYDEFQNMCLSVLKQTTIQDTKWFIAQIQNISTLKQSVRMPQRPIIKFTPLKRQKKEEDQTNSYSKERLSYKNIPYQDLITKIKAKEADVDLKIQQVKWKRKSVTFSIMEDKCSNLQQTPLKEICSNRFQKGQINRSNYLETEQNLTSVKKSILKNSHKFQEAITQKKADQNDVDYSVVNNRGIPSFTFQLPQIPEVYYPTTNPQRKSEIDLKFQQIYNKYRGKVKNDKHLQICQPFSARYESIDSSLVNSEKATKTFRSNLNEENKRLDNLKNKIQGFLMQNAQKIHKSKAFSIQLLSHQQ